MANPHAQKLKYLDDLIDKGFAFSSHQEESDYLALIDRDLSYVVQGSSLCYARSTPVTDEAEEVHAYIRKLLMAKSGEISKQTRIIYGGSVSSKNAKELSFMPNIDGFLVGGASLDPEEFARIIKSQITSIVICCVGLYNEG